MAVERLTAGLRLAMIVLLAMGGCAHGALAADRTAAPGVAQSVVERGPVRVTVEVRPSPARLSDEPTLTLSIAYQAGVKLRKPEFGQSLGDFLIRDFREPLPHDAGDRTVWQQIYTLEPTRAGRVVLAPIAIAFVDNRAGADGREHTVETDPVTVEITSAVGDTAPTLGALRPPADVVEIPPPVLPASWKIVLPATVLLGLAGGGVGLWLWRRRHTAARPLSPRELAERELQRLIAEHWSQRDVKQYYVELTGVVRRYIERSTGIRAPEQTTQEFLREISLRGTFPDEEGRRLSSFLEAADLVKFAAHRPQPADLDESLRRAQAFLAAPPAEVPA